jgi:1-acyl-sn-glycerol-3-phosphate acyltransferase
MDIMSDEQPQPNLQSLTSLVDEGLFSVFKILDAIGLGAATKRGTWQVATSLLKQAFKLAFGFRVQGMENIPATGPAIICTRSSAGAYPIVACVAVAESRADRILHQVFDIEFFKITGIRSLLHEIDAIEVNDAKILPPSLDILATFLQENELVGMTLAHERRSGDEKEVVDDTDLIDLAIKASVPIVPVQIPNVDEVLDVKTGRISLNQKITVTICEPYTKHLEGVPASDCMDELQALINLIE